jgi:hypothetical protein
MRSYVVWWKCVDVSEEYTASIFRVEEEAKQAGSKKQTSSTALFSSTLKIKTVRSSEIR